MPRLGTSDLDVFPLVLGTNGFGWTASPAASRAILDAFVAGEGNVIDTAHSYSSWVPGNSGGEAESILGDWLIDRGNRNRVIDATKVSGLPANAGLKAANIAAAAEQSLRRLRTDYIDVYYAHYDAPDTPLEKSISALHALVRRRSPAPAHPSRWWRCSPRRHSSSAPTSSHGWRECRMRSPLRRAHPGS